jgi:hypothetical protein
MKKVAILINDIKQQYEGLRLSLGVSLTDIDVQMVVFGHEIANMDEAYQDNMEFFDEIGGQRISNNMENAEKYGFAHATIKEIAQRLKGVDLIIPF